MLRPDQLADLAATLTRHGYTVSTHQTLAAARLLARTAVPDTIDALAPWLAPVFCCDAQQQREFDGIYRRWARVAVLADAMPPPELAERGKPPPPPAPLPPDPWTRGRRFLALTGAAVVFAAGAMLWWTQGGAPPQPGERPNPAPTPGEVSRPSSPSDAGSVAVSSASAPIPTPKSAPLTMARAFPVVVGSAAAALFGWLILMSRRRGFLERHPGKREHTELHLRTAQWPALTSWRTDVATLGRTLRRRVVQLTSELDIAATLAHYCRDGILSRLFFGSRHEPEYVVLIDRVSRYDHFARIADELVHALHQDSGVNVHVYVFNSDPRILRRQPVRGKRLGRDGVFTLDSLQGLHPQARVLVFSDGERLISPASGRAPAWQAALRQWPHTALITPRAQAFWSAKEYLLRNAGLDVVPLDSVGLSELGRALTARHGDTRTLRGETAHATPGYLRDAAWLLDRVPPATGDVDQLLTSLRVDLGARGYAWLCACAVYPEIHWGITLTLGRALLAGAGDADAAFASTLVSLSALPWLRWGYLPDWLRERLVDSLGKRDAATARDALAAYLMNVTGAEENERSADSLRIGQLAPQRFWQDVWRGLTAMARSPRSPAIREDRVYLRFMSGNASPLAVVAGARIAQLFYQHGARMGRPKPLPFILAYVVVVGAVLLVRGGAPPAQPADSSPPPIVEPSAPAGKGSPPDEMLAAREPARPAPASPVAVVRTPAAATSSVVLGGSETREETPMDDDTGNAKAYPVKVSVESTGGRTSRGPEQRFRFRLAAEPELLEKIRNVVYFMDHPTFTQKNYPSSDASSGFEQSYVGWGCLQDVVVTIHFKAGGVLRQNVDMCAAANGTPPDAEQPERQVVPDDAR